MAQSDKSGDNEGDEEKQRLLEIIKKREGSHAQYKKLALMIAMILDIIIINLIRGQGNGSGAGIHKCSATDWVLFAIMIAVAAILTALGTIFNSQEYK